MVRISLKNKGFTIIELLIAIVLGCSIVTFLASSWWAIINIDHRVTHHKEAALHLENRLRIRRFAQSLPAYSLQTEALTEFKLSYQKDTSELIMLINPGAFNMPGAISDFCQLRIQYSGKGYIKMTVTCPGIDTSLDNSNNHINQELPIGFGHFKIEVLDETNQWVDHWLPENHSCYPSAIRLTFTETQDKPDFIIQLPSSSIISPNNQQKGNY